MSEAGSASKTRTRVELIHGQVKDREIAVYEEFHNGGVREEKMLWSGTYSELAEKLTAPSLAERCEELERELAEVRKILQRCEVVIGLQNCDECEHSLVLHFDRYGCEYDRGDRQVQDVGAVAMGPCGCKAENLSDDGNDAFLLLRDLRQMRILREAESLLSKAEPEGTHGK